MPETHAPTPLHYYCKILLHNEVLLFYSEKGLEVQGLLTYNSKEFCGGEVRPYRLYLELKEIEQRTCAGGAPQTNSGFGEHFNRTGLDAFFREEAVRSKLYESVEILQRDLDECLYYHNRERPYRGYMNMGRRHIERIEEYLQNARKQD